VLLTGFAGLNFRSLDVLKGKQESTPF
jgi:hypothetical protein